FGDGGTGSVINQGNITAANGGYVAMLGNKVINEGVITAQMGTVALGAGSKVSLQFNGNKLLGLTVNESTLNNLAANNQLVKADGGLVFMSAGAKDSILASTVNSTGVIEAQTVQNQDGKIILMGGMTAGTTNVAGTLDASAAQGNGGFIETSAAYVQIAEGTKVTTQAENGETGTWLIDPTDFNIEAGTGLSSTSSIGATTLSTQLGGTNVQIQTLAIGTEDGDINVNGAVSWASDNNLTLTAHKNININQSISAAGATAKLKLEYGQASPAAGNTSDYHINNGAQVNLHAGDNFSTLLGNDALLVATEYIVITQLGTAGSLTGTTLQGINGNLSGNYVLGADINASDTSGWNSSAGFKPLGGDGSGQEFTGVFDGLNHTITKLTINRTGDDIGLFGAANGAMLKNVGLIDANIIGGKYTGGLGGSVYSSTIHHSYVKNSTVETNARQPNTAHFRAVAGGVIGYSSSNTISDSYSETTAVLAAGPYCRAGGLVGISNSSAISNSHASGSVTASFTTTTSGIAVASSAGGLVGMAEKSSTITNSYATGSVTAESDAVHYAYTNAGGLVGSNIDTNISQSYATTGAVQAITKATYNIGGYTKAGGLVGYNNNSQISDTYATGDVTTLTNLTTANVSTGGLIADNLSSAINKSYATGKVTVSGDGMAKGTGGLVGQSNGGSISDSYAIGSVNGHYRVGGLVGYNLVTSISNSYSESVVTGSIVGSSRVGGLVGDNGFDSSNGGDIDKSYATGIVNGGANVGGLVGISKKGAITDSYATGPVTGTNISVGGLVGRAYNSNITNSYATGDVDGDEYVGGLVGYADNSDITNSYATGDVDGDKYVGGLLGRRSGTVSDSFWNTTTSRLTNSVGTGGELGITGKTTTEMQQEATFTNWDISSVGGDGKKWRIYEGDTSPLLRSFMTQLDLTGITTYDGTTQSIVLPDGTDASLVQGLTSGILYSSQQGYDIAGGVLTISNVAASPSSALRTIAISLLPAGTAPPAQTQVTLIDANNPLTASGGEEGEGGGFINDPQSKTTGIDVVYSNCDSGKDCDKDATP
ncbi:MAG: hypothetical protein ACI8PW_000701, partial [Methylophilaceae bacterium]